MSRFDRCSICDYTEAEGSSVADVQPGRNGRVRLHPRHDEFFCSVCLNSFKDINRAIDVEDYDFTEDD